MKSGRNTHRLNLQQTSEPKDIPGSEPQPQTNAAAVVQPERRSSLSVMIANHRAALSPRAQSDRLASAFFSNCDSWAISGGPQGGNRTESIARIRRYVQAGNPSAVLDLRKLGLDKVPPLPPTLRFLELSDNCLTALPDDLPSGLQHLHVERNQLTYLPHRLPEGLTSLDISSNKFWRLPEGLPSTIENLTIFGNKLSYLPGNLPASLVKLDAFANLLDCLPDSLPSGLQLLNVDSNRLSRLPETLPDSLTEIVVFSNSLTRLPVKLPKSLQIFTAFNNQISSLPGKWPPALRQLSLHHNRIGALPAGLPSTLEVLDVKFNVLSSLPDDILALDRRCQLCLHGNQFPENVLLQLRDAVFTPGYAGPTVHVEMARDRTAVAARPLHEVIGEWYGRGSVELVEKWKMLESEDGADHFSRFLDRLHKTKNAGDPKFIGSVQNWLNHLLKNDTLRETSFLAATGATESCEDRVSLTYNEMKKHRVCSDVMAGCYDQKIDQLVDVARGMFRLEMLEKIAFEKVKTLSFTDEVEVYLAYQVHLKTKLKLPIDTVLMRFFDVSGVTKDDLKKAEDTVKALENVQFTGFLACWAPWQSVLERLDGDQSNVTRTELGNALEKHFDTTLHRVLSERQLANDPEARRQAGPMVSRNIAEDVYGRLTKDFLAQRKLERLLDKPW